MKKFKDYIKSVKNNIEGFFKKKNLKIISTFNGIGAFSESLKQLGIDSEMEIVCEIDDSANETYFKNFNVSRKNLVKDIRTLVRDITLGIKIDILVQTAPCQSFSIGGLREGFQSDNGNLFLTAIQLQKKVDSTIVIYENVEGLVSHHKIHYTYKNTNGEVVEFDSKQKKEKVKKEGLVLVSTKDLSTKSLINLEFDGKKKSIGHTLHTIEKLLLEDKRYNYYWKVINSCDQGLPQNRERIFIIGIKKELDKGFKFPDNVDLKYSVEDVLEKNSSNYCFYKSKKYMEIIPSNQKKRENRIHTYGNYKNSKYGTSKRVTYPYVSPCITTGNHNKFFIEEKVRFLTTTELKRVQGFREEFEFIGTKTQKQRQLGNTVSPGVYINLIKSLSNSVILEEPINNLDYKPKKSCTKKLDKNIEITRKVTYKQDSQYLYLKKETIEEYETHLKNGGTIIVNIEIYKSKEDKKNGIIHSKKSIKINCIKLLGLVNRKYGFYRVKVSGITNTIENTLFTVNHKIFNKEHIISNNCDYIPIREEEKELVS